MRRSKNGKNLVLCRTDISAAAGPIETGPARMTLGKMREKYKVRGGPKNARAHPETRVDPEDGRFLNIFQDWIWISETSGIKEMKQR